MKTSTKSNAEKADFDRALEMEDLVCAADNMAEVLFDLWAFYTMSQKRGGNTILTQGSVETLSFAIADIAERCGRVRAHFYADDVVEKGGAS